MVKGLHLSLRRYVLWTLLAVGSVLITLFSMFSAERFFQGMDGMLRGTMVSVASNTELTGELPQRVLNFYISAEFDQQPEEILASFRQDELIPFVLAKDLKIVCFFTRPFSSRFLVMVPLESGEVRYISQVFGEPKGRGRRPVWLSHELVSIIIGISALVVFAIVLLLIMRSVTKPVEMLQDWAAALDEKQLDAPIPRFRYKELNALASLIHNSLQSVKQTLERERTFVNHASHELRTPIAVIRSSTELLQRVLEKEQLENQAHTIGSKGENALMRIDNASKTMTDLTETLLWLAREDSQPLPYHPVDIATTVEQLCDDLAYLLKGKTVTVDVNVPSTTMYLPDTASRIIIGNVIRNAFQHTDSGVVSITLCDTTLTIENQNDAEASPLSNVEDTGYGLGLKLITKLTERLGWQCQAGVVVNGYHVTLTLNEPENTDV
jgi:signal transduction histidine kinase